MYIGTMLAAPCGGGTPVHLFSASYPPRRASSFQRPSDVRATPCECSPSDTLAECVLTPDAIRNIIVIFIIIIIIVYCLVI